MFKYLLRWRDKFGSIQHRELGFTMTSEELEAGLAARGFTGMEGMDSMGKCHKDEKHFILRTDGLIIYSDVPFWTNHRHDPNVRYEMWPQEDYSDEYYTDPNPVFTWEALDKIIQ